jgi:hypothetical protein
MKELVQVWISKYAATKGVIPESGYITDDGDFRSSEDFGYFYFRPTEFYFSKEEAIEDAKRRIQKNIESSIKQQLKLQAKLKKLEEERSNEPSTAG